MLLRLKLRYTTPKSRINLTRNFRVKFYSNLQNGSDIPNKPKHISHEKSLCKITDFNGDNKENTNNQIIKNFEHVRLSLMKIKLLLNFMLMWFILISMTKKKHHASSKHPQ